MTVGELIEELSKLPRDRQVWYEDKFFSHGPTEVGMVVVDSDSEVVLGPKK